MVAAARQKFNAAFSENSYRKFLAELNSLARKPIEFRIAESPVFIPEALKQQLVAAGEDLIRTIRSADFKQLTENSIPPAWKIPYENDHPHFLTFDFAVTRNQAGNLTPRLIELQGFPSLYAYQSELAEMFKKHYPIPPDFTPYFSHPNQQSYLEMLRRTIIGANDPAEVILLDIHAETQKTAVDFDLTALYTGLAVVSLSELFQRNGNFYYHRNGRDQVVKRIYNRLIFDEVPDKSEAFKNVPDLLTSPNVDWVTHPNWFYRISKYTMPFLKSEFVSHTVFLSDLKTVPENLENYVLKPLFSFAGQGVMIDVSEADIKAVQDPGNWVLQEKVTYEPVIQAPDGLVKCEIRLMYLWPEEDADPTLVMNLVRLSRGKMIGVDFNKDFDWVGGTVGFFPT